MNLNPKDRADGAAGLHNELTLLQCRTVRSAPRRHGVKPAWQRLVFDRYHVLVAWNACVRECGMSGSADAQKAIVEPNPTGDTPEFTMRALSQRIRQQSDA